MKELTKLEALILKQGFVPLETTKEGKLKGGFAAIANYTANDCLCHTNNCGCTSNNCSCTNNSSGSTSAPLSTPAPGMTPSPSSPHSGIGFGFVF